MKVELTKEQVAWLINHMECQKGIQDVLIGHRTEEGGEDNLWVLHNLRQMQKDADALIAALEKAE